MLYHLFDWLNENGIKFPGSGLLQFISFRILLAVLLSLIIATVFGKQLINYLHKKQIGETVRELGLAGEEQKRGTPTMGGIIIILAILIPTLLFADLTKVYIRLMLLSTVWLAIIGFIDDFLKIKARRIARVQGIDFKKTDADGLAARFKIFGQVMLGIIIGTTLYFNDNVVVKREIISSVSGTKFTPQRGEKQLKEDTVLSNGRYHRFATVKTPITTIPFVKTHEFNYAKLLPKSLEKFTWVLYILIVIFIITAVSNGANITD